MGSWFKPLQHLRGQLAGVVSNPPYIPAGDMSTLQVSSVARLAVHRLNSFTELAAAELL